MALSLVPRSARALAAHINSIYRVLKGVDQDSIRLRLASGGGSFEIHHSATDAALFRVTDAGLVLPLATVPAGSITSTEIQDRSIAAGDIALNTITTNEIANDTIATADLAANAITNSQRTTGGGGGTTNSVTFVDFDGTMVVNYVSSGGVLLVTFVATVTTQTIADIVTLGVYVGGTDYAGTSYQPAGAQYRGLAMAQARVQPAAGTVVISPRWKHSTTLRSAQNVAGEATLVIIEHKR